MGQKSVGMRALPRGKSVGGKSGVNDAQVSQEIRVGQVVKILPKLAGIELAFVDYRASKIVVLVMQQMTARWRMRLKN